MFLAEAAASYSMPAIAAAETTTPRSAPVTHLSIIEERLDPGATSITHVIDADIIDADIVKKKPNGPHDRVPLRLVRITLRPTHQAVTISTGTNRTTVTESPHAPSQAKNIEGFLEAVKLMMDHVEQRWTESGQIDNEKRGRNRQAAKKKKQQRRRSVTLSAWVAASVGTPSLS